MRLTGDFTWPCWALADFRCGRSEGDGHAHPNNNKASRVSHARKCKCSIFQTKSYSKFNVLPDAVVYDRLQNNGVPVFGVVVRRRVFSGSADGNVGHMDCTSTHGISVSCKPPERVLKVLTFWQADELFEKAAVQGRGDLAH